MRGRRSRLALVLLGDRLVAAWLRKDHTETFIVEAEQPSAALRAELDARRVDARAVALGLSRASVSVKPIDLPTIAGEIREMVRFELERHLPFPTDDAAFDFLPLPVAPSASNPAGTGSAHVLVVAADRRVVDSALRIATEARLRPRSLTVAAHNLLSLVRPPLPQRVVWLHRTGEATDLLFLVGSRLVLSRRVPSAEDAVVADEIRGSFPVVRWAAADALWISGDVAAPTAPSASPLTDLGAPVTEPPYTPAARRRLASVPHETRGAAQLAIAVASGRRIRPLDLIPAALRPRRVSRGQTVTLAVLAATVILSLGALFLPGYLEQRRLDTVNASIKNLDAEVRTVDRIVRDLEQKRKLATTIESLPSSAIRPLPVLRELTELLPADAWLTTLSIESKGVEMTGQAAAASTLIPVLENSPRFQRVEFASPVTRGRDKEQFRIQAGWETPPGSLVAAAIAAPPAPAPGPSRAAGPPTPSALAPGGPSSRPTDAPATNEMPAPRRPGAAPSRAAEPGR
jgi:Tfp pilus assembly protein PilN